MSGRPRRRLLTTPGLLAPTAPLFCALAIAASFSGIVATRTLVCLLPFAVLVLNRRIRRL